VTVYENNFFYFFWKSGGIPSSFGNKTCFLDILIKSKDKKIEDIVSALTIFWGEEDEFGLLNRLDNDTFGLLYFAKFPLVKQIYKKKQQNNQINKIYLADVNWNFSYQIKNNKNNIIDIPIAHHKFEKDRMVVVGDVSKHNGKTRGNLHYVETNVELLYYDETKNISTLKIIIKKWIRHQIRAHLANIWYSIVWDRIYGKSNKSEDNFLHLRSVWFQTN